MKKCLKILLPMPDQLQCICERWQTVIVIAVKQCLQEKAQKQWSAQSAFHIFQNCHCLIE